MHESHDSLNLHRLNAVGVHALTCLLLSYYINARCLVQSTALVASRRSLAEAAAAAAAIKARLGPAARFKTGKAGKKKARKRGAGAAVTATAAGEGAADGRHRGAQNSAKDEVGAYGRFKVAAKYVPSRGRVHHPPICLLCAHMMLFGPLLLFFCR